MGRLTRDGTAEPFSRDQKLRGQRGQGNIHLPCSVGHERDWQPYPVDPYFALSDDHTYIHTNIHTYNSQGDVMWPVRYSSAVRYSNVVHLPLNSLKHLCIREENKRVTRGNYCIDSYIPIPSGKFTAARL